MGKYHNVLYIGIKVAWDWGVVDSQAVKELLGNMVHYCINILWTFVTKILVQSVFFMLFFL